MYDFESLIEEILRNRPDISRESLLKKIEEKKNTIGSGYLTDQGALFLIANELGVNLDYITSSDLLLRDLYIGANDVTVIARILGFYPVAEYSRRDGTRGIYRRVLLFDKDTIVKLTLWDERVNDIENQNIVLDSPVRIRSGYVRQGIDGKINLHLGKRGKLELLQDERIIAKLVSLNQMAIQPEEVKPQQHVSILEARVASEPQIGKFTKTDGKEGTFIQFKISGNTRRDVRVVLWNPTVIPQIKLGEQVRITNLRARESTYGGFELHGDAATLVLTLQEAHADRLVRVIHVDSMVEPTSLIVVDEKKRVYTIQLKKVSLEKFGPIGIGDLLRIKSESTDKENSSITISEFSKGWSENFPDIESLTTKLNEVDKSEGPIMVEVIALSKCTIQEVHLKDGTTIKKGELIVGDDTAEMKLIAWREQVSRLQGIEPGSRLRLIGVNLQVSKAGTLHLQLSSRTLIQKLRIR